MQKCMVILRDCRYDSALFGLVIYGNIISPVIAVCCVESHC